MTKTVIDYQYDRCFKPFRTGDARRSTGLENSTFEHVDRTLWGLCITFERRSSDPLKRGLSEELRR